MCIDLNIVAVDLPGHGQSSHRPSGCRYNFVEYLTDIKRVIDGNNDNNNNNNDNNNLM